MTRAEADRRLNEAIIKMIQHGIDREKLEGALAEALKAHTRSVIAACEQRISVLEQAVRASDLWLRAIVEKLDIDAETTRYDFFAVNGETGESRPLDAISLASQLESNKQLICPQTSG